MSLFKFIEKSEAGVASSELELAASWNLDMGGGLANTPSQNTPPNLNLVLEGDFNSKIECHINGMVHNRTVK